MTARPMTEAIERVILRRLHESKIEGYTLPMAQEIAALLSTSSAVRGMREAAEMIRARLNDIEDAAKKCDSLYGVRIRQVVEDMRSDLFDEVKRQTAEKKL